MVAELVPLPGALGGPFAVAFLAATLLPAQSELVLAGLIAVDAAPGAALLAVATFGDVLSSFVSCATGRGAPGSRALQARRSPLASPGPRGATVSGVAGVANAVLGAPVGNLLTLAAGNLREPMRPFLALVTVAKLGRYVVVVWLAGLVG